MGMFTWTYADIPLTVNKNGDYAKRCTLQYGGYGAILTPDNEIFATSCYEGYGIFSGADAYELAAEWNRPYLKNLLEKGKVITDSLPKEFDDLMLAWYDGDDKKVEKLAAAMPLPYLREDWKRVIGIAVCCSNNPIAPCPIKIIKTKEPKDYKKYPASISTQ